MAEPQTPPIFFIHVMKTGGATFRQHLFDNFGPGEVYPDAELDLTPDNPYRPNFRLDYLLSLDPARRARIRAYMGHFPFVATELLGGPFTTLTILRNPVDRTLSYLKHCKRFHPQHRDLTLEQIYEDPFYQPKFIRNHQAKIFSMKAQDAPISFMDEIEVDEDRLRLACANLERVDVLALHEHYHEFAEQLQARFGWRFGDVLNWHVSIEPWSASKAFLARIAADNAADMAFYEYAQALRARRMSHASR